MLIHSITFSNFYSFRDEQTISFVVNEHAPDNDAYCMSADGKTRLTMLLGVFGPNAGGKTNLLRAFSFLRHFICLSFQSAPNSAIPYLPFAGSDKESYESTVESVFEIDNTLYRYKLRFTLRRVLVEELYSKNLPGGKRLARLFKREWIPEEDVYTFKVGRLIGLKKSFIEQVRGNASVISVAVQFHNPMCVEVFAAWGRSQTNVNEVGRVSESLLESTVEKYSNEPELLKKANRRIRDFDLGLLGFSAETGPRIDETNKEVSELMGKHSLGPESDFYFKLPIHYESAGTKNLLVYLSFVLPVLEIGGFVVWDELDSDLHPAMLETIVEDFLNHESNPNQCQIVFGCHHAPLLRLLDKYQILLVEKDETGASEVWRLDEMTGLRADDNYYTKYITGAYGAIPNV